jgi:hypothetical protein
MRASLYQHARQHAHKNRNNLGSHPPNILRH